MHSVLDRKGYLLHEIIYKQKSESHSCGVPDFDNVPF